MSIKAIVFDLDGTLIDGYEAIHEALNHAVTQLGHRPFSLEETRLMVGHGLESLLEESVGKELAPQGVELFRNYYPKVAVEKTRLLPGVTEVLPELSKKGYCMSVASNKPENFSRLILEATGVASYFAAIAGPDHKFPPKPHPAMLHAVMRQMNVSPAETVCVGDMEVDLEFARAAGCRVILIPSGSRDRAFLETLKADLLIDALTSLPEALTSP